MEYYEQYEKEKSSEAIIHERESRVQDKKPLGNYEKGGHIKDTHEVFGLKNSFDDISVGADNKLELDEDALKKADISTLKSIFTG